MEFRISLSRIILFGFIAIALLPLLHIPPWFDPAPWGKTVIFRTILPLLIFAFLIQLATEGNTLWTE